MTTMNQQNIESQICDAVQILAERAIEQARYDKTISALIVECVDTKKGKYKVKYQDSFFYATSDNTELNYRKNTEVYVLVPEGDFAKNKKILGTVKDMSEEYAQRMQELNNTYYEVGKSVIWEGENLCSYKLEDEKIYTDFQVDSSFNDNIRQYGSKLRLSADIQTALPPEHRGKGTYGITAALNFTEEETGESITHTFTLDVDSMIGDPYSFGNPMRQKLDFEINGSKFNYIEYFKIYSKNFIDPEESREDKADNIFIGNIQLVSLANKTEGYVKIIAKDGHNLNQDHTKLIFTAVPMLGNQEIKNENAKYYWFSEDSSIDETSNDEEHTYYSPIGGKGWYWLNPESLTNTLIVTQEEQIAKKLKYLCVIVLDNEKYKDTFEVVNENAVNSVEIISINGTTEFIHDRGKTTLICKITGGENLEEDYTYYWNKIDNSGANVLLTNENGDSKQILKQISNLEARMKLSEITYDDSTKNKKFNGNKNLLNELGISYQDSNILLSNEQVYNNVQSYLIENGLTCIIDDTFYDVRAKNIVTSAVYKCTVKNSIGKVVGVASIKLRNIRLSQNNYTLKINNGTQVFKYDINGRAPRDTVNEKALVPKELSVSLYDSKGNEIQEDYEIRWSAPTEKTLIENVVEETIKDSNEKERIKLSFGLKQNYNNRYVNNDIEVEVIYKGESIRTTTDFTFIKEGFSGTNGTDYYCKIVPENGDFIDGYTFITYYQGSKKTYLNTNRERIELDNSNPFTVYLYNNGIRVEEGYDKITWKILDNEPNSANFKPITIASGKLGIDIAAFEQSEGNYVGIVQAEVEYNNKKFFAELPIGLVIINEEYDDSYILEIKEGSGFNEVIYTSDGTNPQYNSGEDFITYAAIKDNTGFEEDISHTLTTCNWTGKSDELTLKINADKSCNATPIKQYNGLSSDIFVKCETDIGTIYFPILFRLNRYGFSALNDWDGKGIKINEDENYILSPQIGAGKKDSHNRFTGVLMGVMKESNGNEDIGLLGFNEGERTIFLDSQTGKAEFGKIGAGQIIIDPRGTDEEGNPITPKAKIYSGNFYNFDGTEKGEGLLIDLTTPEIKFGSGKFKVNSKGEIKSTAGTIGGWNITSHRLWGTYTDDEGKTYFNSFNIYGGKGTSNNWAYAISIGSDSKNSSANGKFKVRQNGEMYATGAVIDGTLTAGTGSKIGPWNITTNAIYKGNSNFGNSSGMYFGTGGLSLGSTFKVTSGGALTATSATIGGWTVNGTQIKSGNIVLDSSKKTITAGSNFSVSNNGTVTAKSINISGGSFNLPGFKLEGTNYPRVTGLNFETGGSINFYDNKGLDLIATTETGIDGVTPGGKGHMRLWASTEIENSAPTWSFSGSYLNVYDEKDGSQGTGLTTVVSVDTPWSTKTVRLWFKHGILVEITES